MKLKLDITAVQYLSKTTLVFTAASFSLLALYEVFDRVNTHLLNHYWWSCYWSCLYGGFSF